MYLHLFCIIITKWILFFSFDPLFPTVLIVICDFRLNVHVLDINDNAPIFINQPYYAIVPIDATRGKIVKRIMAVDRDVGKNGDVHYKLVGGGDGKLGINARSGEIYLSQQLSLDDQNKQMVLHIRAQDRGNIDCEDM